jgi:stage V sporulation protein G
MEITDIRIRRIETVGKLKAVVSVTFDDMFAIHDMKIIEGQSGYFIAMPSRRTSNGEYKDIAHPINSEARAMIQAAILEKFESLPDDEGYASFQM